MIEPRWLLRISSWITNGRTSIFAPKGTPTHLIFGLSVFVLGITAVMFLAIAGILPYVLVRFRRRATDSDLDPAQIYGSSQIELSWTVIPSSSS